MQGIQASGPPGGDPSMIVVPPVEQWRSSYLFLVPNKYAFDSLLIAAPAQMVGNLRKYSGRTLSRSVQREIIGDYTLHWQFYVGAVLVAVVLFAPNGLATIVRSRGRD